METGGDLCRLIEPAPSDQKVERGVSDPGVRDGPLPHPWVEGSLTPRLVDVHEGDVGVAGRAGNACSECGHDSWRLCAHSTAITRDILRARSAPYKALRPARGRRAFNVAHDGMRSTLAMSDRSGEVTQSQNASQFRP
jgi:hypothetical protein